MLHRLSGVSAGFSIITREQPAQVVPGQKTGAHLAGRKGAIECFLSDITSEAERSNAVRPEAGGRSKSGYVVRKQLW